VVALTAAVKESPALARSAWTLMMKENWCLSFLTTILLIYSYLHLTLYLNGLNILCSYFLTAILLIIDV
jgi:hypothetical protein